MLIKSDTLYVEFRNLSFFFFFNKKDSFFMKLCMCIQTIQLSDFFFPTFSLRYPCYFLRSCRKFFFHTYVSLFKQFIYALTHRSLKAPLKGQESNIQLITSVYNGRETIKKAKLFFGGVGVFLHLYMINITLLMYYTWW